MGRSAVILTLVMLYSGLTFAGGGGLCGLPEQLDSDGVTQLGRIDLINETPTEESEKNQVLAAARAVYAFDDDSQQKGVEIAPYEKAIEYLKDAYNEELYLVRFQYRDRNYTVVYGYPGDNRGGFVFPGQAARIIAEIGDDGFTCVD